MHVHTIRPCTYFLKLCQKMGQCTKVYTCAPPHTHTPSPALLMEGLHTLPGLTVPQSDGLVIATGQDEAAIRGELCTTNPVTVTAQCELKLLSIHRPHLGAWSMVAELTLLTAECDNVMTSYHPTTLYIVCCRP